MEYWIYSAIIPIGIIALTVLIYRPVSIQNIAKAFGLSLIPLVTYALLIYSLEIVGKVNSGWIFYTLMFFFTPYLVMVMVLNLVAFRKKK
jgi:hypothetical protein